MLISSPRGCASVSDPRGNEYGLLPTQKKRGTLSPPQGWVHFAPGMNTKRRTITQGYLRQRMPRNNTVASNQNYVTKVLENPRTPRENREEVIAFVLNNPERFMTLCDRTDDPVHNEWAMKRNGNADFDFLRKFKLRYGLREFDDEQGRSY